MKRLALFCALASSPALGQNAPFANPLSDPGSWVSNDDFPGDAAGDQRGHIYYNMIVGRDGRIRDCMAIDEFLLDDDGSSRFARLTCSLLRARARYEVSKDGNGRALLGNHAGHIYWYRDQVAAFGEWRGRNFILQVKHAKPPLPPTPEQRFASLPRLSRPVGLADILGAFPSQALKHEQFGVAAVRLQVNSQGRLAGCRLLQSSGYERLDRATCKLLSRRRFVAATDKSGKPVAFRLNQAIDWQLNRWLRLPVALTHGEGRDVDLSFDHAFLGGIHCAVSMDGVRVANALSEDVCDAFRKTREREMVPGRTVKVRLAVQ